MEPKAHQLKLHSGISSSGFLALRLFSLLITLFVVSTLQAAPPKSVPGRILVKTKTGAVDTNVFARFKYHGIANIRALRNLNVRALAASEDRVEALLAALRSDPDIEYAERDYLAEAAFTPNDPYVSSGNAWHLTRVQATQAWDITIGLSNVVIAVLDSGVNAAHPDLASQLLPGYDFVSGDDDPSDDFGHGTAVAGTVAAAGNNGIGIAGVAYGCRLLPVKVMDASGFAAYSAIAEGIRYAVDQGARVINISIVGSSPSATLQDAIDYAWSHDAIVVAAAGNFANNIPQYPAACTRVVAVSAIAANDSLAPFSSYGNHIMFSAPGDAIWTTHRDLNTAYTSTRGTSFASPIVAAVAGLVASANPSLSNTGIVAILQATADDLGPSGNDPWYGRGNINAARAALAASLEPGGQAPGPGIGTNQPSLDDPAPDDTDNSDSSPAYALLTVLTNGIGKVTPNLNGRQLEVGGIYSMKAVPGKGQSFAGWNGNPSLPPNLTFTMQSNLVLTAEFIPSPFPVVKGSYAGLLASTNGVSPESAGYFTLAVTTKGQFTGKLMIAGKRHGFRGQLDVTGKGTATVKRGTLPTVALVLQLDLGGGTDEVVGHADGGGWAAELVGDRNVFNSKLNPAQQAGSRAFVLERAEDASITAGSGSSAIAASGSTRVKGRLADGRAFSSGSLLARNGDCPFYLSLNRGSEVVIGWLNFPATAAPTASGTVLWVSTGTNAFAATLRAASAP